MEEKRQIFTNMNICVSKYSNIFKYPNICYTLGWTMLGFTLAPAKIYGRKTTKTKRLGRNIGYLSLGLTCSKETLRNKTKAK